MILGLSCCEQDKRPVTESIGFIDKNQFPCLAIYNHIYTNQGVESVLLISNVLEEIGWITRQNKCFYQIKGRQIPFDSTLYNCVLVKDGNQILIKLDDPYFFQYKKIWDENIYGF